MGTAYDLPMSLLGVSQTEKPKVGYSLQPDQQDDAGRVLPLSDHQEGMRQQYGHQVSVKPQQDSEHCH